MPAKKKVEIEVVGKDKTARPLRSVTQRLKGLSKVATMVGGALGITGIAGAAFLGVRAVKSLTNTIETMVREALPLQGIKTAFENITEAAGISGEAMLRALQDSTAGMVTARDLMESYNQAAMLVSDTFAQQLPEALELVTKISLATGESMDYLMGSLVRGIGRVQPLILDNLMVQIDLNETYRQFAVNAGVATDKIAAFVKGLSKTQQQAILMDEVMRQMRENTAALPEVVGMAAQSFASLSVMIQDTKDRIGERLLPVLGGLAVTILELAQQWLPVIERVLSEQVIPKLEQWAEEMAVKVPLAIDALVLAIHGHLLPALRLVGIETPYWLQISLDTWKRYSKALAKIADLIKFVITSALEQMGQTIRWLNDVIYWAMRAMANIFTREGKYAFEQLKKAFLEPTGLTSIETFKTVVDAFKTMFDDMRITVGVEGSKLAEDLYGMGAQARSAFLAGLSGKGKPPTSAADLLGPDVTRGVEQVIDATEAAFKDWDIDAIIAKGMAAAKDAMAKAAAKVGKVAGSGITDAIEAAIETVEQKFRRLADSMASIGAFFGNILQQRTIDPMKKPLGELDAEIERITEEGLTAGAIFTDLIAYQERLAELTTKRVAVAAELEEHQKRMMEMEEERFRLGFLQQQMQLLDTIKEHGLDAAEVLMGIPLGLEASVSGLVQAMGRALSGIVGKTQGLLQATLPAGIGMAAATPAFAAAGPSVAHRLQLPLGAAGNTYNLTIYTNAETEPIIDDFEMMQRLWG